MPRILRVEQREIKDSLREAANQPGNRKTADNLVAAALLLIIQKLEAIEDKIRSQG